jgi:hypothetical protein
MYICIYVTSIICTYVSMYLCTMYGCYVRCMCCLRERMYVCTHACMHVCMYVCMYYLQERLGQDRCRRTRAFQRGVRAPQLTQRGKREQSLTHQPPQPDTLIQLTLEHYPCTFHDASPVFPLPPILDELPSWTTVYFHSVMSRLSKVLVWDTFDSSRTHRHGPFRGGLGRGADHRRVATGALRAGWSCRLFCANCAPS